MVDSATAASLAEAVDAVGAGDDSNKRRRVGDAASDLAALVSASAARLFEEWTDGVLATYRAFSYRADAWRSSAAGTGEFEPFMLILVEVTLDSATTVELVVPIDGTNDFQIVALEGTTWKYDMRAGPLAAHRLCNRTALDIICPTIGTRYEKLKAMRTPIPDAVKRLKDVWEYGVDVRAATGDSSALGALYPCVVCRSRAEPGAQPDAVAVVDKCCICLLTFHASCGRMAAAIVCEDPAQFKGPCENLRKKNGVLKFPRCLLADAEIKTHVCGMCATLNIASD